MRFVRRASLFGGIGGKMLKISILIEKFAPRFGRNLLIKNLLETFASSMTIEEGSNLEPDLELDLGNVF